MQIVWSPSAVLAVFATLLLAFLPFMYFWEGRDPDLVTNYVYCSMTYEIEEIPFTAMIILLWVSLMVFVWFNFSGVVRKRMIIISTIHSYLHYLLGRTNYRPSLHALVILLMLFTTLMMFFLSRRWNWLLVMAFVIPGILAYILLAVLGGSQTERKIDRSILYVYAISTHWPTFVFVFWLLVLPSLPVRIARLDAVDKVFDMKSTKSNKML